VKSCFHPDRVAGNRWQGHAILGGNDHEQAKQARDGLIRWRGAASRRTNGELECTGIDDRKRTFRFDRGSKARCTSAAR
jgi:hypothetical protein